MTHDGQRLTPRQAAGYVFMRLGFVGYCGAWVGGFVWLLS